MTFETKTESLLFMDVSGWSKLEPDTIHRYVTTAMPKIETLIRKQTFLNTWGDAIVATFASVKDASESALRIRDFFRNGYSVDGISPGLACRISLHLGEVILCHNALLKRDDIFGEAVHTAARLEPMTAPGQVFCTRSFADRLNEVRGAAPKAWPLPERLVLPKNFGEIEAFVVTGANDVDPRPGLIAAEAANSPSPPFVTMSDVPDETTRTLLRGASKISLSGISLFRFLPMFHLDLNNAIEKGGVVRILLCNPAGAVPSMLALRSPSQTAVDKQRRRIEDSIDFVTNWQLRARKGAIELRVIDYLPSCSITLIEHPDTDPYCFARIFPFGSPSLNAPALIPGFRTQRGLYDFVLGQFSSMWISATDLARKPNKKR